jgi:D-serine dehydratase
MNGSDRAVAGLKAGRPTVWCRDPARPKAVTAADVRAAEQRMRRFAPVLHTLFPGADWDGRVVSPLLGPVRLDARQSVLVKADHALPITGSVKARGGVHELLVAIERIAVEAGLLAPDAPAAAYLTPEVRHYFAGQCIVVGSTGNLGFSIGLLARAFGLQAEVHMSRDAKHWKKQRLRALGVGVVEHPGDFTSAVEAARTAAQRPGCWFVDDENSRELMLGYAVAAAELAGQLQARGIRISAQRPLCVYLPCGVGGAPAGITFGLKQRFGADVTCVFVEPVASASMMAAMTAGNGRPLHVATLGLDNATIADGLAVPRCSPLALATVGDLIDGIVTVADGDLLYWVRQLWVAEQMRLEPAAAAGFAAVAPWLAARGPERADAVSVVWTTGGALLPDEEFHALLGSGEPGSPRAA